jgi:type-IV secretion system protein TraC
MGKILDLGVELLKAFLAPKEELKQTNGLAGKNLRAFLEHKGVSDFLMYRYYEEVDGIGIYHLADGRIGFIVRVFPSSMSSDSIEESIFSLIDTLKIANTIIHINTFASRNIGFLVDNFKALHHSRVNVDNAHILKEMIDDSYEFLKEGANESVVNGIDLRIRDFVNTISVLLPENTSKTELISIYNQLQGNLRKVYPSNFDGTALVTLLKEMLNPQKPMQEWNTIHDKHRVMNKQIATMGTSVKTSVDNGDITVGEKWKYRVLTTKQFPNEQTLVTSHDFYGLFFDRLGENMQIPLPCPFFTSLVVVIGNSDEAKEKALKKSRDDMRKVKKLKKDVIDEQPELSNRLKESKRNITLIEQNGQTPLEAMWSVTIMEEDEAKLEKYSKVIKDRFSGQKNWYIEEEKFGNVALFVWLYSFPLQHHHLVQSFVKRFDILFTSNSAAIAPLLGNISTNEMLIPYLDRNGQLMPYDNFSGDNYNEFKTGASGAGKSYSQAYSHIMKLSAGVKQRVIDNGHSYRRFCKVIGGTYIDVGGDSSISMNFFTKANSAKVLDDEGNDTDEELLVQDGSGQLRPTLHKEEIAGIVPIIGLMVGLNFVATGKVQSTKDATDEAFISSIITRAVIETFIQYGHNGKLEYTRDILLRYYEDEVAKSNQHQSLLIYSVYSGLFDYADPSGSEYIKFNTPNNIDLTKDYVVLDTLGLKGKTLDIVTVSLAFTVKSEFWKEGIKRQKSLDIDEGWNFKDNPLVVKILEDNARTFRKSKSSQCFITQGIEDASDSSSMKALFGSSFHKFLLAQDNKEIQKVSAGSFFPLSPFEEKLFMSVENKKPHWGEALYISKKSGSNAFIIKASQKVHWLCAGADPDGNTLFDMIQKKYNLSVIETVRFLAKRDKNQNYTDNDLLYHAKNYSEQANLNSDEEKKYWKEELKNAIEEERFRLKLEPIVSVSSSDILSYETFLELVHHDGSVSSFPKFIPFAYDFNYDEEIFGLMLKRAFSYFEEYNYMFHLNLNTNEIRNYNKMELLEDMLKRYSMKDKLVLELKETDTNQNIEELSLFIERFSNLGAKVALDNIGLHYHKMTYIVMLNVDYIKVEGELIQEARSHEGAKMALELITALSHKGARKKSIVATKIEKSSDVDFITEIEFDSYQGFINQDATRYV